MQEHYARYVKALSDPAWLWNQMRQDPELKPAHTFLQAIADELTAETGSITIYMAYAMTLATYSVAHWIETPPQWDCDVQGGLIPINNTLVAWAAGPNWITMTPVCHNCEGQIYFPLQPAGYENPAGDVPFTRGHVEDPPTS